MINRVLLLFLVIFSGIIQISFLTTWPNPIKSLNLILLLAVFIAILINYRYGLFYAFGAGIFLELYSVNGFGILVLSLMTTVIAIHSLFKNFFTNKSLYSLLILGFLATIIYNVVFWILHFIWAIINLNQPTLGFRLSYVLFWQPLLNLLFLGIIYIIYRLTAGRIRNIFILPSNHYEKQRRF